MIKNRQLLLIFIPAILLATFIFFIRFVQYEPLRPKDKEVANNNAQKQLEIPIFPNDPIIGDKKAGITIITFEDYGCESCKAQMTILEKLIEKHPNKIKIIWKGLPATQFPYSSNLAHEYSYCANQQDKFLEFSRLAFANNNNLQPEILNTMSEQIGLNEKKLTQCLESGEAEKYISTNEQLGLLLNIQSVPTIFLNNKQIENPQILEHWETLLNL